MRIYCGNCKTETRIGELIKKPDLKRLETGGHLIRCPACSKLLREAIPDFETTEQFAKRTGKMWPNEAPVWFRNIDGRKFMDGGAWGVCRHITAIKDRDYIIVCVQLPEPPPDDWKP